MSRRVLVRDAWYSQTVERTRPNSGDNNANPESRALKRVSSSSSLAYKFSYECSWMREEENGFPWSRISFCRISPFPRESSGRISDVNSPILANGIFRRRLARISGPLFIREPRVLGRRSSVLRQCSTAVSDP